MAVTNTTVQLKEGQALFLAHHSIEFESKVGWVHCFEPEARQALDKSMRYRLLASWLPGRRREDRGRTRAP